VCGSIPGRCGLDVVEDRLKDKAAALVENLPQVFLEVESGNRGDRPDEKAGGERSHLLAEAKAGLRRQNGDRLKFLTNNRSRGEGENDRLDHGGRFSLERSGPRGPRVLQPSFS
jgi:hypothetical protein